MRRIREVAFVDSDPLVVIIGAGQSGLQIAARLRNLGVTSLVLEKTPRVGDNVGLLPESCGIHSNHLFQWRNRYDSLCLLDPVCKSLHPSDFLRSFSSSYF